ncbi:hypothetical protein ACX0K2_16165 [Pseudomonas extremorientalis]
MNEFLRNLLNEPSLSILVNIAAGFVAIIAVYISSKILPLTRSFRIISKLFLYEETDSNTSKSYSLRLSELESQIESINKMLSSKTIDDRREAIDSELQNQLSQRLPELIDKKIKETKAIENSLNSEVRGIIEKAVSSYLIQHPPAEILQNQREQIRIKDREKRGAILENTIQEQMNSAGRLKMVMINLFVLFNTGVLMIYFFAGTALTDKAVTTIIGLYISLAAFIVYIYRTSNFRSSVLLALHEDGKKYYDAEDYLRRLKPGASPTDRDVEVLKLLLLNRSEREKMADHPYELILKGVTNSNIQLKGGKMISSTKGEK